MYIKRITLSVGNYQTNVSLLKRQVKYLSNWTKCSQFALNVKHKDFTIQEIRNHKLMKPKNCFL